MLDPKKNCLYYGTSSMFPEGLIRCEKLQSILGINSTLAVQESQHCPDCDGSEKPKALLKRAATFHANIQRSDPNDEEAIKDRIRKAKSFVEQYNEVAEPEEKLNGKKFAQYALVRAVCKGLSAEKANRIADDLELAAEDTK